MKAEHQYCTNAVVLVTRIRDATVQGREPPLGGFPSFSLGAGCCVLYESTAVAVSSHTREEATLG